MFKTSFTVAEQELFLCNHYNKEKKKSQLYIVQKVSDTTMDSSKCNGGACHIRSRPCSDPLKPSEKKNVSHCEAKLFQCFKDCHFWVVKQ